MRIDKHEKKWLLFVLVIFTSLSCGCASGDFFNALSMKKYVAKSERREEEKRKKDAMLEIDKLKPGFMFADDEKYFKNYLLLKEEFFLLNRFNYVSASSVSNFLIDRDSNFMIYDKAAGCLMFFNRLGVLLNTVRLNFGSESRILAPTNMVFDQNGNIIMACSILGRFYRFSPGGALLNSTEIAESEGAKTRQLMYATKIFKHPLYTIYADMYSKKAFFYAQDKKCFEFQYENMSDDVYFYFSADGDIFLVDRPASSIIKVIPVFDRDTKRPYKCSLERYDGDKILKNSEGFLFILRKRSGVVEKISPSGKVISEYGAIREKNINYTNNLFPCDFAIGPDDSLYILDDKNYKINVYNRSGVFSFSFGSYGKRAGKFLSPCRIIVDRLKRIIVIDVEKNGAMVFNSGGEFIENYGDILGSNILTHYGIFADMHEKIHILDYSSNQHYAFNYDFQFLRIINDIFSKKTNYPQNYITVDSFAKINFFDLNGQKNLSVSPDARLASVMIPQEISSIKIEPKKVFVKNLALDGYGNILAVSKDEAEIYKLDTTGRTIGKLKLPKKGSAYSSIGVDMFKNFYLLDKAERSIIKFDQNASGKGSYSLDPLFSARAKNLSLLDFNKNNSAFVIDHDLKKIAVLNTLNGVTPDSLCEINGARGQTFILDAHSEGDSYFTLASVNGSLVILKYKLVDYFREATELFARGVFQEALVAFEKYARISQPNPNALYYMAQCFRKLSKNYDAALIEAEIMKKYPKSNAAKKLE